MSAPRAARTPGQSLAAFVLHRYDWSESSLVLDLFTRELGRLPVVAKGAKRPYSQLRPVLLPFQRLQVALVKASKSAPESDAPEEGTAEVRTLRSAEWGGGHAMLRGASIFSGFYMNELLMKLTARHDPAPELFDAYALTLAALAQADDPQSQAVLRAFELKLLACTGVLPELACVTTTQQPLVPGQTYAVTPEAGVLPARAGEVAVPGEVLVVLQAALTQSNLPALQQACALALSPLRAQLRHLLHYHLGTHNLRTRQVMRGIQTLG